MQFWDEYQIKLIYKEEWDRAKAPLAYCVRGAFLVGRKKSCLKF